MNNETYSETVLGIVEPEHNSANKFALHEMLTDQEFQALLDKHEITPEFIAGLINQKHSLEQLSSSVN